MNQVGTRSAETKESEMKAYQLTGWQSPPEMREVPTPSRARARSWSGSVAPAHATRTCT